MNLQPETFDLRLEKLTYGGEAMGRLPDSRAVFVPFGLPGERVRVRLVEDKKNFARGEIVEILEPSPERITANCKHFFSPLLQGEEAGGRWCGGCHYQHLPYEKQLQAKTDILIDQLQRIGKIENPPVQPMVPSPRPWNYRNHVQFHLTEEGKLGYVSPLPAEEGVGVMAVSECHLPEPPINELWTQLEFEAETGVERVSLRLGADDDLMLLLESDSPEPPSLEIEAEVSAVHVYEQNTVVLAGSDHLFMRVLDRTFKVSAASFFQVNTVMAEKMVEHLNANLPITNRSAVLDVYCGVGLFSAFLAPNCRRIIGVESSRSACEDFAFNLDEFDNVELYEGEAEAVIPHLEAKPDFVVVDPPRAGLDKAVVDGILHLSPRLVAYVSCDPSTLARDAARLIKGGYRLKNVTPFDMFPQTYHIESVSLFER
ncbi:MAG: 23S rRNA (uracil(1939)-C(5))-methyltransferase RlmD [Anaerolineales bacterium]